MTVWIPNLTEFFHVFFSFYSAMAATKSPKTLAESARAEILRQLFGDVEDLDSSIESMTNDLQSLVLEPGKTEKKPGMTQSPGAKNHPKKRRRGHRWTRKKRRSGPSRFPETIPEEPDEFDTSSDDENYNPGKTSLVPIGKREL